MSNPSQTRSSDTQTNQSACQVMKCVHFISTTGEVFITVQCGLFSRDPLLWKIAQNVDLLCWCCAILCSSCEEDVKSSGTTEGTGCRHRLGWLKQCLTCLANCNQSAPTCWVVLLWEFKRRLPEACDRQPATTAGERHAAQTMANILPIAPPPCLYSQCGGEQEKYSILCWANGDTSMSTVSWLGRKVNKTFYKCFRPKLSRFDDKGLVMSPHVGD